MAVFGRERESIRALASGVRTRLVTIQQSAAPAGGGYPKPEWTDLMTVKMSRTDQRADERFAAGQDSAFTEARWSMRYHPDMDPELVDVPARRRLVYEGRQYNIRGASLLERRLGIEIVTLAKAG